VWSASPGISGRHASESVVGLGRYTQLAGGLEPLLGRLDFVLFLLGESVRTSTRRTSSSTRRIFPKPPSARLPTLPQIKVAKSIHALPPGARGDARVGMRRGILWEQADHPPLRHEPAPHRNTTPERTSGFGAVRVEPFARTQIHVSTISG
jgi:hypothetical protein